MAFAGVGAIHIDAVPIFANHQVALAFVNVLAFLAIVAWRVPFLTRWLHLCLENQL